MDTSQTMVQVMTVCIFFPIFHALGSKIGLWMPYFSFKKKKEPEWD